MLPRRGSGGDDVTVEVRSAMVTAWITLVGTGDPIGWVVFAVAIADDLAA